MPLFLSMLILKTGFDLLAQYTSNVPKPQFLSPFCHLQTPTFLCPRLKTVLSSQPPRPGVPISHAVPLSLRTRPACVPLSPLPAAQFLARVSPLLPPPTHVPPLIFCLGLCTLPRLSQHSHRDDNISASPADTACGQSPGAGGFGGAFRRERSLSPPVQVSLSPRFPLKGSPEKRRRTTFCTPNSAEQKSRSLCSNLPAAQPVPPGPLGPLTSLQWLGGTGKERPGGQTPRAGVCVCVCVSACAQAVSLQMELGRPRLGVDFLWMTFPDCLKQ